MKILQQGKVPEPEKPWWAGVKCQCKNCGCQFELEESDLHRNASPVVAHRVKCPTLHCGDYVRVPVPHNAALAAILRAGEKAEPKLKVKEFVYTGPTTQLMPECKYIRTRFAAKDKSL